MCLEILRYYPDVVSKRRGNKCNILEISQSAIRARNFVYKLRHCRLQFFYYQIFLLFNINYYPISRRHDLLKKYFFLHILIAFC